MIALLALLMNAALASDVLVPTVTPSTMSDFGLAEGLTQEIMNRLSEQEIAFVSPSEIRKRAGAVTEGCAEEPTCLSTLWQRFPPARIALVGSVTWQEGMVNATMYVYGPNDVAPLHVIQDRFPETGMGGYAEQVVFVAAEVLGLIPNRGGAIKAATAPTVPSKSSSTTVKKPRPVEPVEELDEPEPEPRPKKTSKGKKSEAQLREEFRQKSGGMPDYAWRSFKDSGKSYEDWAEDSFVRKGKVLIELSGGGVFGDIDRQYDTRVAVEQQEDGSLPPIDEYQYESFMTGRGFGLGGAVAYVPLWWLEAGIGGGAQVGHKEQTTGWEQYVDGEVRDSYVKDWGQVQGWMGFVEPRVRIYGLAIGPVKPYAMGHSVIRIYDGFTVADANGIIDYPDRAGGASLGFGAGGGLAFDVPGGVIGFLEVPWTKYISPQPYETGGTSITTTMPATPKSTGSTLTFRGGIGIKL
jgi:hypothetical protein